MKRLFMRTTALVAVLGVATPGVTLACERCFGAAVDSPVIAAISASMFLLIVLITGVFGGIVQFFRNVHEREKTLRSPDSPPSND